MEQNIKVLINAEASEDLTGELVIESFDHSQLMQRSFKKLGICWGIALACVFIPILHFVLVPGFIITGIILFFANFSKKTVLQASKLTCPKCHDLFELSERKIVWPTSDICEHCSSHINIKPV